MSARTEIRYGHFLAGVVAYAVLVLAATSTLAQLSPGECLTTNETTLADLLNDYRVQNGLAPVPVTRSLTAVAQWHVWDLDANHPHGGECNLHSWSDWGSLWTAVCYTADHANASGMWLKPREITANIYTGNGFEIAYSGGGDPASALNLWKQSPAHNDVILNAGVWESYNPWPAMGVGMGNGYAVVWFGSAPDPQGTIQPCSTTPTEDFTWGKIKSLYE